MTKEELKEEIEKIVAVHYGAGTMIVTMEGKITDGVIDLRDKMTKELQDLFDLYKKELKESVESMKNGLTQGDKAKALDAVINLIDEK